MRIYNTFSFFHIPIQRLENYISSGTKTQFVLKMQFRLEIVRIKRKTQVALQVIAMNHTQTTKCPLQNYIFF